MKHNVGSADRAVRILFGIVLLLGAVVLDEPYRWFGLIGIVPLLTGVFRMCPLYSLIGINTCSTPKARA